MSKLTELELRLRNEPDNLGLAELLAGALHEAGRHAEAVELYRSVALAYRERGQPQQSIAACRSLLALAPDDASCRALLTEAAAAAPSRPSPPRLPRPPSPGRSDWELEAVSEPDRPWSGDLTPLPAPLPHHLADPTRTSQPRLAREPSDDLSVELETRRIPRITDRDLEWLSGPLPEEPTDQDGPHALVALEAGDEDPILLPGLGARRSAPVIDEDKTLPDGLAQGRRPPSIAPATQATGPLASALFAPVPPRDRAGVLQRFRRRTVAIGTTVIRRGETGHGLVLVVRGRLDQHTESADGARVSLGEVAPGDFVGEVSLLAEAPAPAYVVAAADCELLVLGAAELFELIAAFPALGAELAQVAERRAREHARLVGG